MFASSFAFMTCCHLCAVLCCAVLAAAGCVVHFVCAAFELQRPPFKVARAIWLSLWSTLCLGEASYTRAHTCATKTSNLLCLLLRRSRVCVCVFVYSNPESPPWQQQVTPAAGSNRKRVNYSTRRGIFIIRSARAFAGHANTRRCDVIRYASHAAHTHTHTNSI